MQPQLQVPVAATPNRAFVRGQCQGLAMLPAQQKFENNQYSQQIKVETSKNNLAIEVGLATERDDFCWKNEGHLGFVDPFPWKCLPA